MEKESVKYRWLAGAALAVIVIVVVFPLATTSPRRPVAGAVGISFLYFTNTSSKMYLAVFALTNGWNSIVEYAPALPQIQSNGAWGMFSYRDGGGPVQMLAAHTSATFSVQAPNTTAPWRVPVGVSFPPRDCMRSPSVRGAGARGFGSGGSFVADDNPSLADLSIPLEW